MLPGKWSHGRNSWGMGQRGLCPQYFPNALNFSMVAQWCGFLSSHQIYFLIFSHQIPWKSFSATLLELTTLPHQTHSIFPTSFYASTCTPIIGWKLRPWVTLLSIKCSGTTRNPLKGISSQTLSHRWCLILLLFAGDVGLSGLADASFEPMPSTPEVVPVGGRLEIRCLLPQGVPTPVHRLVSCCFCDNWQPAVCQT